MISDETGFSGIERADGSAWLALRSPAASSRPVFGVRKGESPVAKDNGVDECLVGVDSMGVDATGVFLLVRGVDGTGVLLNGVESAGVLLNGAGVEDAGVLLTEDGAGVEDVGVLLTEDGAGDLL